MDTASQKKLLLLARRTLENDLQKGSHNLEELNLPEFRTSGGVFVTLHIKGKLRGCIGRLESDASIFKNTIELSRAAAFEDHRFRKLSSEELRKVTIEISILSKPKRVSGESNHQKIARIIPGRDGVILSAARHSATFLPQVWDSIPERDRFIGELCRKAGLPADYWKNNPIDISVYQVDSFEE